MLRVGRSLQGGKTMTTTTKGANTAGKDSPHFRFDKQTAVWAPRQKVDHASCRRLRGPNSSTTAHIARVAFLTFSNIRRMQMNAERVFTHRPQPPDFYPTGLRGRGTIICCNWGADSSCWPVSNGLVLMTSALQSSDESARS